MKYYIHNITQQIFAHNTEEEAKEFNEQFTELVEISESEVDKIIELKNADQKTEQQKAENIAFLRFETERTEAEIKVYERMHDRGRADANDLKMLEALEEYSIDLKKVTKQKDWPLEVEWPVEPKF
ncbi:MAG: hypothetical protein ACRCXK_13695 [Wohlfahrtiimonas sp.]